MRLAAGLLLALASAAALSYGFYLQHTASGGLPALSPRHPLAALSALFTSGRWLAGFIGGLAGWGLYIVALDLAPLSLVQATSAGGVGLLALFVHAGGTRLGARDRAAVAASVGGLLLLGLSLPAGVGHAAASGWGPPLGWILASVLAACVAASPAGTMLRPGAGLAAAAGLLYAAGDVSTKAAVSGIRPVFVFALLLPVCHGLAFVCLQLAFQRGTALATAGVSTLLTNLLPILAGLTVFAEQLPGGISGVLRGAGFAAAVLGAALLAGPGAPGQSPGPRPAAGPAPAASQPSPPAAPARAPRPWTWRRRPHRRRSQRAISGTRLWSLRSWSTPERWCLYPRRAVRALRRS
jgi:hypothetical protein